GVNQPAGDLFTFHQTGTGTETIKVSDSIVTDTTNAPPALAPCFGNIEDHGGNIEWPGTTCGFATNADPQLDLAIALHGGRTFNYRLLPTSPAIDLGGAVCPTTDQRDVARPDGDACDAGSYETPGPETAATGPASDPTNNPQVTFSSPDTPTATFQCKVDAGSFTACTSPYSPSLSDGPHTVFVRAVTTDGYVDQSPASVTFTVDKTAPVVEITVAPASPTNDSTPTIEFTVDDPTATVECQVDGGTRAPCTSPFTSGPLPEGIHTFTVYATDPVGNVGSDSVNIAISFGPPDTIIDSAPSHQVYNQPSATFTFHSTKANSTFECKMDSGAWAPCTSPHTVTYAPGTHQFYVRAIDIAGVPDPTPASYVFSSFQCRILKIVVNPLGQPAVLCL
ncbi:MAG: large repetitive protein, partial [Actinomycetota bacterium]